MSFFGLFPSEHQRRVAQEEAVYALNRYGDEAEAILARKARESRSRNRRMIYRLARKHVWAMGKARGKPSGF